MKVLLKEKRAGGRGSRENRNVCNIVNQKLEKGEAR